MFTSRKTRASRGLADHATFLGIAEWCKPCGAGVWYVF